MTDIYIIKPHEQIARLNELLYFHFVTEDGLNFKFPYMKGTTRYVNTIDADGTICKVCPEMFELAGKNTEVASIIGNDFYSYDQLVQSGKIKEEE